MQHSENIGRIVGVGGNLVTVEFDLPVVQNEVAYVRLEEQGRHVGLKAEVIRVRGRYADVQVFEATHGLCVGDKVIFTGELLSVELGPGLLGQVFDGLQNPLDAIAAEHGFFLARGSYYRPLDAQRRWDFTPCTRPGERLRAGMPVGHVPEAIFRHAIMVPYGLKGWGTVVSLAEAGPCTIDDVVAVVLDEDRREHEIRLTQQWPVKIPVTAYAERLRPTQPMTTKIRIIDTYNPVALGGVYCIPGPFGAGKTVLQQITSRHADVDVVVVAACGERAGEVVETIRTFPELEDPRTGRSLMERTIIICNTSSMPVASREASVYTAVTMAEHYRQMGLKVLLLADSTSRWAQALREMSGRLEEIPGEEAFPAYLESVVAAFYERGGVVRLHTGETGSVTIGGTVSPAGGNFEEPVTQATLKVVGAFLGLSRARSDARRYPAIDPLGSWSHYDGVVDVAQVAAARQLLTQGFEVKQMMQVVGDEGTSLEDYLLYLKAEFLDAVYLQQDAYDPVDGATDADRQRRVFSLVSGILAMDFAMQDKDSAKRFFLSLTQTFLDFNRVPMDDPGFEQAERAIRTRCQEAARDA
ncbi:V-type ATP synthase subunit A [Megalodesulfovibrio gigas]|uniref:V-type ATP synthase alpha chain n=1 Tax=Megalodesulfovibrio gigas (strain ATCC 19364 / DSM 1382 / NCIMB 9332 / VKM B-1759) TaxID=1121448 RepID=T2GEQ8_MEGG1|nr:V-type ATP synthase subunit A [Megalodesulfovibrio gigas]AGW14783.1 putative V-type ATP synthase subunit A [Megalodesulfovibrio gigas DSM 1382 = ATCC 19364]